MSAGNEADAVAYPEDMGVNGHGIFPPEDGLYHICRFASYDRELDQILQIVGHFTVEVLHQHLCHAYQMLGFVVGVGDGAYIFEDDFGSTGG